MFKKFTIILIAILFVWNICLTVKKNKEKFTTPLSQPNLLAIKNLGDLASQIQTEGKLNINDLTVGNKDYSTWISEQEAKIEGFGTSLASDIATIKSQVNDLHALKAKIELIDAIKSRVDGISCPSKAQIKAHLHDCFYKRTC